MKRIESYFLPQAPGLSQGDERTARLLIRFNLISIAFAVGYFFNTFVTGFIVSRYTMVAASLLFAAIIFAFKYGWLRLRMSAAFFTAACWVVMFILSMFSGGIRSYILPWITLIPVLALALSNGKVAFIWALIGLFTVVFFFNFDVAYYVPARLLTESNDILIASVHLGLQFIILSIFYFFEREQSDLIGQLEDARNIIQQQNDQLHTKNEYLEAEIQKRTGQLVNYNQQLEQFAFMASHNLRAPIARLIGLGNIFSKSHGAEDEEFIRTRMLEATRELDNVVRDMNIILDVQKNRATSLSDITVRAEIEHVLAPLTREIEAVGARIQLEVDPDLRLTCIKPYFQNIIYNLVSNAMKYRKADVAPVVIVRASVTPDVVQISISDNGLGINLAQSGDKIFSLYSRFHEGFDGKGIGLYMVKIQSEAMGGSVQVESKPGEGSVFTVTISRLL